MFVEKEFEKIKDANEFIKKVLAELDTPSSVEFQIIHSISETECREEGGTWDDISAKLINFLRDLDSQQGYMIYDEKDDPHWDYIDWDEPEESNQKYGFVEEDESYVCAGEGVAVIVNPYALCEDQYPIIVVKRSFFKKNREHIFNILKIAECDSDYTVKISPAIYIELFECTEPVTIDYT